MTIVAVLVLLACIAMWLGALRLAVPAVDWMLLSFALLITAYLVGLAPFK